MEGTVITWTKLDLGGTYKLLDIFAEFVPKNVKKKSLFYQYLVKRLGRQYEYTDNYSLRRKRYPHEGGN